MSNAKTHSNLNVSTGVLSVLVALVLVGIKLWALAATGALSVAASLADSAVDLMVSIVATVMMIYAAKPADEDHAFGHTSAEDLAALAQSLFIVISAGVIAWAAVARLLAPSTGALGSETLGLWAMGISAAMTLALVARQGHVTAQTGSRVVAADRMHYIGDLIPTLGAMISLLAARWLGLTVVDSVVALAAAAFMVLAGFRIGKGAWDALMDRRADPAVIAGIERIARTWPGVHGFHDLKTRTAGSRTFVNLHIELDGDQSLRQAHAIGAGLRRAILQAYPQADVIIHKDVAKD
jgi:ferrous-iron efflux pump FieF